MDSSQIILAVIGVLGCLVVYFKKQSDKNKKDAILGDTKGQDKILAEEQAKAQADKLEADKRLKEFYAEREKLKDMHKTKEERAKDWNKND